MVANTRIISPMLGALVALCVLPSCTTTDNSAVIDAIRSQGATESRERSYVSVFEALPESSDPANAIAQSDRSQLVVRGEVVSAEQGVGAIWNEEGSKRTDLSYGDPAALMSTVYLKFLVTEIVDAGADLNTDLPQGSLELSIGLWVEGSPDVELVAKEFGGLGEVVVFLSRRETFNRPGITKFASINDGAWAILESGAFVGEVQPDGSLDFPLMDDETRSLLVPDIKITLLDLEAASVD